MPTFAVLPAGASHSCSLEYFRLSGISTWISASSGRTSVEWHGHHLRTRALIANADLERRDAGVARGHIAHCNREAERWRGRPTRDAAAGGRRGGKINRVSDSSDPASLDLHSYQRLARIVLRALERRAANEVAAFREAHETAEPRLEWR